VERRDVRERAASGWRLTAGVPERVIARILTSVRIIYWSYVAASGASTTAGPSAMRVGDRWLFHAILCSLIDAPRITGYTPF
jgi:hypothetical protein